VVTKVVGCFHDERKEKRYGSAKKSGDVEKCALYGMVEMNKQTFWQTNRLNRTGQA